MRVIISAGGTGGHIYPALAIINKIKEQEPNSEFLYIGTHNRMEKDIVPKYNIPFESIEIYGLSKKIFKNFKTLKVLFESYKKCKKIIKEFKPDIVIGVGGYVTLPVVYAAKKMGYKTFIHEQNSYPGKTNLFLSKYSTRIAVSFESTLNEFPEYKTYFTGNPCTENALKQAPIKKSEFGLSENKKLVLFVMGSLGSSKVNKILVKAMEKFVDKNYEVLFVTGKDDYENIKNIRFSRNVKVVSYLDNMTSVMKRTDVIVSRAGATTLSEIISLKLPSILIPSPYVANDHQYKNAIDLVENNAAILLEEKKLNPDILIEKIDYLINNEKVSNDIKNNLTKFDVSDSSTKIYNIIKEIVDRN